MIAQKSDIIRRKPELKVLLTKREKQVLQYLANGYTNIEIGRIIFLSQSTVHTYRKNLLRKFNARNSCHLIFLANNYLVY